MSNATHTDEQQDTENYNSRIAMSELCSRVIKNEELNELMHIKHKNSDQDKMNLNDAAGVVVM